MVTKEMEKMVDFIQNMESEEIKQGLKDFYKNIEELNNENISQEHKIRDLKVKIEVLLQEQTKLKSELNKRFIDKIKENIKDSIVDIVDLFKSEKSGM